MNLTLDLHTSLVAPLIQITLLSSFYLAYLLSFTLSSSITTAPTIQGAEIIDGTIVRIHPEEKFHYKWEGKGIEITIPAGAITTECRPVKLSIQDSYHGKYELPENTVIVSGVYWLAVNPPVKFSKKATIRIQHCADADSAPFFVTAKRSPETLSYKFKPLSGGEFTYPDSSSSSYGYGCIEVEHFCADAIAARKKTFFTFCTYYLASSEPNDYEAHITVTPKLEAFIVVCSHIVLYI